jgi:hypothetical protein
MRFEYKGKDKSYNTLLANMSEAKSFDVNYGKNRYAVLETKKKTEHKDILDPESAEKLLKELKVEWDEIENYGGGVVYTLKGEIVAEYNPQFANIAVYQELESSLPKPEAKPTETDHDHVADTNATQTTESVNEQKKGFIIDNGRFGEEDYIIADYEAYEKDGEIKTCGGSLGYATRSDALKDAKVLGIKIVGIPESVNEGKYKNDQVFMKGKDFKKGQEVTYRGKKGKVVEIDEYPIGTPGAWVKIYNESVSERQYEVYQGSKCFAQGLSKSEAQKYADKKNEGNNGVKFEVKPEKDKAKESFGNQDQEYVPLARGISDKDTADQLAKEQEGTVSNDDQEKDKFMIVKKNEAKEDKDKKKKDKEKYERSKDRFEKRYQADAEAMASFEANESKLEDTKSKIESLKKQIETAKGKEKATLQRDLKSEESYLRWIETHPNESVNEDCVIKPGERYEFADGEQVDIDRVIGTTIYMTTRGGKEESMQYQEFDHMLHAKQVVKIGEAKNYDELAEKAVIMNNLLLKESLTEKERAFVNENIKIELSESERKIVKRIAYEKYGHLVKTKGASNETAAK